MPGTPSQASASQVEYSQYDTASKGYDSCRSATDLDHFLEVLDSLPKHMSSLHVLDYGCGTGNYLQRIASRVAKATGMEPNQGMIDVARSKLVHHPNVEVMNTNTPHLYLAAAPPPLPGAAGGR